MGEDTEEKVFTFLEGKRIDLVTGPAKWADLICKWLNDPKVRHYSRNPWPISLDEVKKRLEPSSKISRFRENTLFFIYHKQDKKPIGSTGLEIINWLNKNANIFVIIGYPEYWGHGLASEVAELVIQYGFEELNLHKIYSGAFEPNERSLRVIEKLGFVKERVSIHDQYVDGAYVDGHEFYLLKDDWMKRKQARET
jgi:ribosomal-protein-alanine N-acetyltransferase